MSIEYILISINDKPSYIRVDDQSSVKGRVPYLHKYKEEFCESTGLDSHSVEVVRLPLISWEKDLLIRETIAANHLRKQHGWQIKGGRGKYYCTRETNHGNSIFLDNGKRIKKLYKTLCFHNLANCWHDTREEAEATLEKHLRSTI